MTRGVVDAIQPLLRQSSSLLDHLIMVLKKALLGRYRIPTIFPNLSNSILHLVREVNSRISSVVGFIHLLKSTKVLPESVGVEILGE